MRRPPIIPTSYFCLPAVSVQDKFRRQYFITLRLPIYFRSANSLDHPSPPRNGFAVAAGGTSAASLEGCAARSVAVALRDALRAPSVSAKRSSGGDGIA